MKTTKTLIMALVATCGCLMAQAGEYQPKFLCGVVKADSWTTGNNMEGIYELDLAGGSLSKLTEGRDVYQAPLGGAVYEDGIMKGVHFKTMWDDFEQTETYVLYHVQYDMNTWERVKLYALSTIERNYISSCGLAHDPVTGKNYGIFYNFNMSWQVVNRKLAEIDFSTNTPTRTIIGTASIPMAAIAFSDQGVLYGVGEDGWLYAISTANPGAIGEIEVFPLGDMGIDNISTNPSTMTYDKRTGKFYWAVVLNDQKSYLYEINPTIGSVAATQLMQLPDNSWLVNLEVMEQSEQTLTGDVNCDGEVTATDITCLYNYLLNGDETYIATSDVDGDGEITTVDITVIYSILLGE